MDVKIFPGWQQRDGFSCGVLSVQGFGLFLSVARASPPESSIPIPDGDKPDPQQPMYERYKIFTCMLIVYAEFSRLDMFYRRQGCTDAKIGKSNLRTVKPYRQMCLVGFSTCCRGMRKGKKVTSTLAIVSSVKWKPIELIVPIMTTEMDVKIFPGWQQRDGFSCGVLSVQGFGLFLSVARASPPESSIPIPDGDKPDPQQPMYERYKIFTCMLIVYAEFSRLDMFYRRQGCTDAKIGKSNLRTVKPYRQMCLVGFSTCCRGMRKGKKVTSTLAIVSSVKWKPIELIAPIMTTEMDVKIFPGWQQRDGFSCGVLSVQGFGLFLSVARASPPESSIPIPDGDKPDPQQPMYERYKIFTCMLIVYAEFSRLDMFYRRQGCTDAKIGKSNLRTVKPYRQMCLVGFSTCCRGMRKEKKVTSTLAIVSSVKWKPIELIAPIMTTEMDVKIFPGWQQRDGFSCGVLSVQGFGLFLSVARASPPESSIPIPDGDKPDPQQPMYERYKIFTCMLIVYAEFSRLDMFYRRQGCTDAKIGKSNLRTVKPYRQMCLVGFSTCCRGMRKGKKVTSTLAIVSSVKWKPIELIAPIMTTEMDVKIFPGWQQRDGFSCGVLSVQGFGLFLSVARASPPESSIPIPDGDKPDPQQPMYERYKIFTCMLIVYAGFSRLDMFYRRQGCTNAKIGKSNLRTVKPYRQMCLVGFSTCCRGMRKGKKVTSTLAIVSSVKWKPIELIVPIMTTEMDVKIFPGWQQRDGFSCGVLSVQGFGLFLSVARASPPESSIPIPDGDKPDPQQPMYERYKIFTCMLIVYAGFSRLDMFYRRQGCTDAMNAVIKYF
ncbi:hypothetical protein GN958_ATG12380 [Phytophthora infestans]|uniref:Uncharacterized protein n=1 Tax=Phytophthora infestans TaxID=4787 RepID=A0A8S9UGN8_PHYIN|nr:hypothetical protein GN958_ATG12380 [Phytophthora infestans]